MQAAGSLTVPEPEPRCHLYRDPQMTGVMTDLMRQETLGWWLYPKNRKWSQSLCCPLQESRSPWKPLPGRMPRGSRLSLLLLLRVYWATVLLASELLFLPLPVPGCCSQPDLILLHPTSTSTHCENDRHQDQTAWSVVL